MRQGTAEYLGLPNSKALALGGDSIASSAKASGS
jgi:hypothetical protein